MFRKEGKKQSKKIILCDVSISEHWHDEKIKYRNKKEEEKNIWAQDAELQTVLILIFDRYL